MAVAGRYSFFFKSISVVTAGWTENFWNSNDTGGPNVTRLSELRDALLKLHGNQVNCIHVRWSRVGDTTRATQSFVPPKAGENQNPFVPGTVPADFPTTAALVKMGAGNLQTRQWLKGMPDDLSTSGGGFSPGSVPNGEWATNFASLFSLLADNTKGWCVRTRDTSKPRMPIRTIAASTGVVSYTGDPIPIGSLVYISRPNGARYAQGFWRVSDLNIVNGDVTLRRWAPPTGTLSYPAGGTIQIVDQINTQIVFISVERITEHAVGRPFGALIGRRRRQR